MKNYHLTHNQVVTAIDKIVKAILFNEFNIYQLSEDLTYLYPIFMYEYDKSLKYDETIIWFKTVIKLIKGDDYPSEIIWDIDSVHDFVKEIKNYKEQYHIKRLKFKSRELLNTKNMTEFLNKFLNHYLRLLMVRVDLGYRIENGKDVGVVDFYQHSKIFRERLHNKDTYLQGLKGYAWVLEQGYKKEMSGSLHCHLLLIYCGAERKSAYFLAKQVGEIWESITDGQGSYFNSHTSDYRKMLRKRGHKLVKVVHRGNTDEIKDANDVLTYLTTKREVDGKFDQRLKIKVPNMRTFGKAKFEIKSRRGIKR